MLTLPSFSLRSFLLVSVLACALVPAPARGDFDIEAYREHLRLTRELRFGDLQEAYPRPDVQATVPPRTSPPLFFREINQKLGLTEEELVLLQRHDFVVSERWRHESYGAAYEWIWHRDLPVYISTDAILHAVHKSYDDLLMAAEVRFLIGEVEQALEAMTRGWPALAQRHAQDDLLRQSLVDVDVYLAVATKLLEPGAPIVSQSGHADEVRRILSLVSDRGMVETAILSDEERQHDFSQFEPRGHYERDWDAMPEYQRLPDYFEAMIWLGRMEFRLFDPSPFANVTREARTAFLLHELAESSGARPRLDRVESVLRTLIGAQDNLTSVELGRIWTALNLGNTLGQPDAVGAIQDELARGRYPAQMVLSQIMQFNITDPDDAVLPTSFYLLGQRFLIDSFITGQVVYPATPCPSPYIPPCRRMPDPLDVLFPLGNNSVLDLLRPQIEMHEYAPNLSALRYLTDQLESPDWEGSLYYAWLDAIRTLSDAGRADGAPAYMWTGAWAQEKLNTQLAAWAELRHDNLLYVKPSYTGWPPICSFPHAYVEPVPAFYRAIRSFAGLARDRFSAIPGMDRETARFFSRMQEIVGTLEGIAEKEIAHEPFSDAERTFLRSSLYVTEDVEGGCGGAGIQELGWYHDLYYASYAGLSSNGGDGTARDPDAVVADIHTDPNHPASVLHAATGYPELGVFVVQEEPACPAIAYVGPVASFFEYVTAGFDRLTDSEWSEIYRRGGAPRSRWVEVYLADASGRIRPTDMTLVPEPEYQAPWDWSGPVDPPDDPPDPPPDPPDDPPDPPDPPGDPPDPPDDPPDDPSDPPDDPSDPPDEPDSPDPEHPSDPDSDGDRGDEEDPGNPASPTALGDDVYFSVSPNPVRDAAILSFRLDPGVAGPAQLAVFDSRGGLVRTLYLDHVTSKVTHVRWDGLAADGRPVAAGTYFVKLVAGSDTRIRKVVILN